MHEIEISERLGELLWGLRKGAGHKYIRRVPKPGGGYRYYYRTSGVTRAVGADLVAGAKFKLTHEGQAGHFEVLGAGNGRVVLRHDESGGSMVVSVAALADLLKREHADVVQAQRDRTKQRLDAARKHGTAKQIARLEAEAKRFGAGEPQTHDERVKATLAEARGVRNASEPVIQQGPGGASAVVGWTDGRGLTEASFRAYDEWLSAENELKEAEARFNSRRRNAPGTARQALKIIEDANLSRPGSGEDLGRHFIQRAERTRSDAADSVWRAAATLAVAKRSVRQAADVASGAIGTNERLWDVLEAHRKKYPGDYTPEAIARRLAARGYR